MRVKMISAFAVKQAMMGKHEIDDKMYEIIATNVEKLHSNEYIENEVKQLDTMYALEMKRKVRKKKKNKQPNSVDQESNAVAEPALKWYGAPQFKRSRISNPESEADSTFSGGQGLGPARKEKSHTGMTTNGKTGTVELSHSSAEDDMVHDSEGLSNSAVFNQHGDVMERKVTVVRKRKNKESGENGVSDKGYVVKKNTQVKKTPADFVRQYVPESNGDADIGSGFSPLIHNDPDQEAKQLFAVLIHPYTRQKFMSSYWTRKPLHIQRSNPGYYDELDIFSTEELDRILREENVRFGTNIDLTTYRDGKRETHNPAGRAYPAMVWDHYQQGCSVRLLNPQTYSRSVWYLLSTLQDMFGCMVGANVYLTPPGTQGFAPHFDDIEGFVLQLEGRKHWKVYPPRTDADIWPLNSSPNLTEADLGDPIVDCMLEPGDLLYFPRGAIHQAMAQDDEHSLHITVSTHQKNTWSDLLNILIPAALTNATENDTNYRESLPNDYLNYTGVAFQEQSCKRRRIFMKKVHSLVEGLLSHAPIDGACDQMAKKFIHDSLPPHLNMVEASTSIADQGERWMTREGVFGGIELEPDTRVRLIRKHSLRLVDDCDDNSPSKNPAIKTNSSKTEEEGNGENDERDSDDEGDGSFIRVYYNTDNDRLYHANTLQHFEINAKLAPAVEFLQLSFPSFVSIDELPCEPVGKNLDIAMQLYDHGLLVTEQPLEPIDDVLHMGSHSECSSDDQDGSEPELYDGDGLDGDDDEEGSNVVDLGENGSGIFEDDSEASAENTDNESELSE